MSSSWFDGGIGRECWNDEIIMIAIMSRMLGMETENVSKLL